MNLGALLDLGLPEDYLRTSLQKLDIDDEYQLVVEESTKSSIRGKLVTVKVMPSSAQRNLDNINQLIESSKLSESVKSTSKQIFHKLAVAEATVHGITVDQVHFHEVGATDAIVDIVGCAIAYEYFQPTAIHCYTIELGSGVVECSHGVLPVPTPATTELLLGFNTHIGRVDGEATTPTGAAILSSFAEPKSELPDLQIHKVGYGLGTRDFGIPNMLRVMLCETADNLDKEKNLIIECNIDDMNSEAYSPLTDHLFSLDALDVWFTPIMMKKTRPATKLSVLCRSEHQSQISAAILNGTTSLGVRVHAVSKSVLQREHKVIKTSVGDVRIKLARLPNGSQRWKIEHDSILELCDSQELSYLDLKAKLDHEVRIELSNE